LGKFIRNQVPVIGHAGGGLVSEFLLEAHNKQKMGEAGLPASVMAMKSSPTRKIFFQHLYMSNFKNNREFCVFRLRIQLTGSAIHVLDNGDISPYRP
jgi:hypothetical protein